MDNQISRVPAIASILLLVLAVLGSWPYGFYTLLRLVVCGSAVYLAVLVRRRSPGWLWLMVGAALLFNPLMPVGLARDTWVVLNALAAVAFGVSLWRFR